MIQQIEDSVWKEFEAELNKTKNLPEIKLQSGKIISGSLRKFWDKFLTTEFPTGEINKTLEKNFAIWICYNDINIETIKSRYKEQKWKPDGLLGYIKKVLAGEMTTFNIKELLNWSNENNKFEVGLLESAKVELEINSQFKVLSDSELENYETKNQSWLVDKLLGSGKINILGGKRGTMKTWLALDLMYCLSHGLKFLGQFDTTQIKVLYTDRENGIDELKQRRRMIKKGLGIEEDSGVLYLSESPIKLDNLTNLDFLEEVIIANDIKLVIGDTYRRLVSFDEDKANFVSQFFVDKLKPLAERTGCSFLLIAHEKKGESQGDEMDMLRGSSDLVNYADGVIQLSRKGNSIIVKQTKNRGAKELEPFEIKIVTDETTYFKFDYVGEFKTKQDIVSQTIVDWIIENRKKEFRYSEALSYITSKGFSKRKFIEAIALLQEQGLINKPGGFQSPYIVCGDLSKLNPILETPKQKVSEETEKFIQEIEDSITGKNQPVKKVGKGTEEFLKLVDDRIRGNQPVKTNVKKLVQKSIGVLKND